MGMSSAMASMLNDREVLKAPRIYIVALLCNIFKGYDKGA